MFEQLPSKYIKQDGKYKIVYCVKITDPFLKFSLAECDWYEAIGCSFEQTVPPMEITADGKTVTWIEDVIIPSQKAIKYDESSLNFILRNTVY